MSDIHTLIDAILEFRRERGWEGYNNPKDIAMYLSVEAGELLEHFLWRDSEELQKYIETHREDIADEIGDIMYCLLFLGHTLGIDVVDAQKRKLEKTKKKYPADKVNGRVVKWTELV